MPIEFNWKEYITDETQEYKGPIVLKGSLAKLFGVEEARAESAAPTTPNKLANTLELAVGVQPKKEPSQVAEGTPMAKQFPKEAIQEPGLEEPVLSPLDLVGPGLVKGASKVAKTVGASIVKEKTAPKLLTLNKEISEATTKESPVIIGLDYDKKDVYHTYKTYIEGSDPYNDPILIPISFRAKSKEEFIKKVEKRIGPTFNPATVEWKPGIARVERKKPYFEEGSYGTQMQEELSYIPNYTKKGVMK